MSHLLYMKGAWRALKITARNFFRPTFTQSIRPHTLRAERFKGSFALVHDEHGEEACIGCGMCEKICPSTVITVVAGGRKESPATGKKRGYCQDFTLDLQACIYCELCVQVCPTDAIVFVREQEPPGYSREDLVLTMEKLYANEKKPLYWANGTKLMAMQEPGGRAKPAAAPAPSAKDAAAPAPSAKDAAAPAPSAKAAAPLAATPTPPPSSAKADRYAQRALAQARKTTGEGDAKRTDVPPTAEPPSSEPTTE